MKVYLSVLLLFLLAAPIVRTASTDERWMYVGTYTRGLSKGIYAFRFQSSTGKMVSIGLVAEATNPSFLAVHPTGWFLYTVNEVSSFEGKNGYISAFSINHKNGHLTFLNEVSSGGSDPCHLTIDSSGKWLIAANYGSGSVSVLRIEADGRLSKTPVLVQHRGFSVNPSRQRGPHAHSVVLSPDNRFLLVSDLGLDKLMVYRFNSISGILQQNDPPFVQIQPGSGPRHLSFHPFGRLVYQINELNSTITSFSYDSDHGILKEGRSISTLPPGFNGPNTTAELAVHPSGRFVYGSNRGHDSIAVFSSGDPARMVLLENDSTQGKTPRHFALDPTGNYLVAANQDSDKLVLFRIGRTGALTPTGAALTIPMPVCVLFVPQK